MPYILTSVRTDFEHTVNGGESQASCMDETDRAAIMSNLFVLVPPNKHHHVLASAPLPRRHDRELEQRQAVLRSSVATFTVQLTSSYIPPTALPL